MDMKYLLKLLYKNRLLIALCAVLIAGTLFGTYVLKIIPENIAQNIFIMISQNSEKFTTAFLNRFCFPFVLLLCIYLSGFSIMGTVLCFITVFFSGCFYGFENALNYMFFKEEFFFSNMIFFLTFTFFFEFMLINMAENSFLASKNIKNIVSDKNIEKSHYNAKNQTVKFISFTAVLAIVSAFSSYIFPLIIT